MDQPASELFDVDARNDPFLAEYEKARDLLSGSDWRQGLAQIEHLASLGSIMSILLVSDNLRNGGLYDQDLRAAEAWYQVAITYGSGRGLFGIGLTHLLMGRFDESVLNLEAAISKNYPPALNSLAGIYFRGDGVPVDIRRALALWRKGAALGHIPAKRNLIEQSLQGRLGPYRYLLGILTLVPVALEISAAKSKFQYSDRLR